MSAASIPKDEIVSRLFAVFRDHGFDGASLAELSQATGLGKSSLYHYFPRGKEQMMEAVLDRAAAFIDTAISGVAQGSEPLKVRVRRIVDTLDELYGGGRTPCVLGKLATAGIAGPAQKSLKNTFVHWTHAISKLANETGMSTSRAQNFAEDWIARLQGALILQAATGNTGPFRRAMKALLNLERNPSAVVSSHSVC